MAAAASSNLDAFPTSAFAALSSDQAALTAALASTEYGCPESDFLSLGFECLATSDIPLCVATAITNADASATVDYNAACCTSISLWGESVESCLAKSAPPCLDTSALLASATAPGGAYATESNPCAPYWNGGKGAGPVQTPGPSTKAGSAKAGGVATDTASTATGTSSGGSTSATKASAANKTGAGLKVYLGLGLVGALAVLTM